MEQSIRFCRAPDGVRIAYATVGAGHPLLVCTGWISHLELDWQTGHARRFWEALAEKHLIIRYDRRGTGLSDRKVQDYSLDAQVADLGAVVRALGLPRVALLGFSQGGPITLAYAHRNPDTVSHLILYGTYARGKYVAISDLAKALIHLIEADWGGLGSLAQADIYIPGASTEARRAFAEYQRQAADKEAALAQASEVAAFDVKDLLGQIQTPVLVMHKRADRPVPFELGRRLARDLPNSRFMPLEGDVHVLTLGSTGVVISAIVEFLAGGTVGEPPPDRAGPAVGIITRREKDVLRLIAAGKSNRQIAEELCISINTADRHVSNILAKVGASNRAQAASFAVRNGMA